MNVEILPKKILIFVLKGQGYKKAKDGDFARFDGNGLIWFDKNHFKFCGKRVEIEFNSDNDDIRGGGKYIQYTTKGYLTWNENWFLTRKKGGHE